jgi:hypothetical protein
LVRNTFLKVSAAAAIVCLAASERHRSALRLPAPQIAFEETAQRLAEAGIVAGAIDAITRNIDRAGMNRRIVVVAVV